MKKQAHNSELLTAEEIIEEFKHTADRWHWTTPKLVSVWRTGGLDGEWDNTIKRHVFTRESVIEYIKFIHRRLRRSLDKLDDDLRATGTEG